MLDDLALALWRAHRGHQQRQRQAMSLAGRLKIAKIPGVRIRNDQAVETGLRRLGDEPSSIGMGHDRVVAVQRAAANSGVLQQWQWRVSGWQS